VYICTMQNDKNIQKLRNEWRSLNLKIAQHQKVIKQNTLAGQAFGSEYLQWVQDLINRRDLLTNVI
jgi:hypothetical protein